MLQTLDSVQHAVACLQKKFPDKQISVEPYLTHDISNMLIKYDGVNDTFNVNPNRFYFGVFTYADASYWVNGLETKGLQLLLDDDYLNDGDLPNGIAIEPNSQIIELFKGIIISHGWENAVIDFSSVGMFRGFEITLY